MNMLYDPRRYLDALLRSDLLAFTQRVFRELRPGQAYDYNWHHDAIAYAVGLTAIDRELNRLIINVPPRSLKSMMVSVALPAFLLGRDPTRRIIVVSYNQDLAHTFSRDCRQVMQSEWYKRLFPSTRLLGRAAETEFATTAGGFRMAASTNGTLTGRGGDLIIIDDPAKADDAYSATARENLVDWATRTLFTRLDDKRQGAIILVQQRQHVDDLTGHMLRTGDWYHLNLPAIAVADEVIVLNGSPRLRVHRRFVDDLLDPRREPQAVLDDLRAQMGVSAFEAQYQQNPSPPDGDAIKLRWFQRYRDLPPGGKLIMSVDTAMKGGLRHDWSVCSCGR